MQFGIIEAKRWIEKINLRIQRNKEYLSDLDLAIGDGDHGLNMARGFQEVMNKMQVSNYEDLGKLFQDVGMVLLSKVGGASGPLYGTVFMKAASKLQGKEAVDTEGLISALAEAANGIKSRGKVELEEKTMYDVWEPVISYMKQNHQPLDWEKTIHLSEAQMESTKYMEAKKGRASYLGKRSIGHIDPGAASSHFLFEALAETFIEGEQK